MAPSSIDDYSAGANKASHQNPSFESSDPAIYEEYHGRFSSESIPSSTSAWLQRARDVASILATDAAARDIDNKSPFAEISLLKSSDLLKVLGPIKHGGGGQEWEIGYKVIREVAKGDGSIGMLLGYHLLWSKTADIVGTDEQKERFQKLIIENNYFVGGRFINTNCETEQVLTGYE